MRTWFSIATIVGALAATTLSARVAAADEPPPAPRADAPRPANALAALDRASAAYDYGDMNQVVDAARPIVDGALPATPSQRIQGLKLLGIGLYLTGRPAGAETAFLELLRVQPRSRLDPMTTRPEVVAFFEDLRRSHRAEIESAAKTRSRKSVVWNFLPPIGQFRNGDSGRGFVLLAIEGISFAGALTTRLLLASWRQPDGTFIERCPASAPSCVPVDHSSIATTLKTWNNVAVGVLATSWAVGVIDAFLRNDHDPDEHESTLSLFMFPGGGGLRATF